jgi:hypothetical protein
MNSENPIPTAIYHASGCRARVTTRHLNRFYTSYDDSQCSCHVAAIAELKAEIERLRYALLKLTNEATGFLAMADRKHHGKTNCRILGDRIDEAHEVLKAHKNK